MVRTRGGHRGGHVAQPVQQPVQPPVQQPEHRALLDITQVTGIATIDWQTLAAHHIGHEFARLYRIGQWPAFFSIQDPIDPQLRFQFMSTFRDLRDDTGYITFELAGRGYNISIETLSQYLDLPPIENPVPLGEWCSPVAIAGFWRNELHIADDFVARASKSTALPPASRYMQALLSRTLTNRHKSQEKLNYTEMLSLLSMHRGIALDVASLFANNLDRRLQQHQSSTLTVGPYVTGIARKLGIF